MKHCDLPLQHPNPSQLVESATTSNSIRHYDTQPPSDFQAKLSSLKTALGQIQSNFQTVASKTALPFESISTPRQENTRQILQDGTRVLN